MSPGSAVDTAPIGLLGGSFDPVHSGHLQLAQDALRNLALAQLVFIPAGQPWQKGAITASAHRLRMLELALPHQAQWRIDSCELDRDGPSYTVDTLRQMRTLLGPTRPLVWILGFDQLSQLRSWHQWERLTEFAHLAYTRRAGSAPKLDPVMSAFVAARAADASALHKAPAGAVVEFAMQAVDCSSSQIRRALAGGQERLAAPFLPEAVLGYIRSQQLYLPVHGQ